MQALAYWVFDGAIFTGFVFLLRDVLFVRIHGNIVHLKGRIQIMKISA